MQVMAIQSKEVRQSLTNRIASLLYLMLDTNYNYSQKSQKSQKSHKNCNKHLVVQKKMITFADGMRAFFGLVRNV